MSAPSAATQAFGAAADELQEPRGRRDVERGVVELGGDGVGHVVQPPEVGAERARDLARRRIAQRWLDVNAGLVSGSQVSMSAPGAPIEEICTVAAPAARARVSASLV